MDAITLLNIRFSCTHQHQSQRWRQAESNRDGACIQLKAVVPTLLADGFISQKSKEDMKENILSQQVLEKQKKPGNLGKLEAQ